MATVSEMFINAITEANKSARAITDQGQKALAYAAIATALATTGAVNNNIKTDDVPAAPAANEGKESLKTKPAPAKTLTKPAAPAPAPAVAAAPAPAQVAEPVLTEEWTEEAMVLLKAELEFIQTKQVAYGDDPLDACVVQFSNGVLKSVNDINPMNIKGFVAFIEQCEADQEAS